MLSDEEREYHRLVAFMGDAAADLDFYGDSGRVGPVLLTRWFKSVLNLVRFLTSEDPTEVQGKVVIKKGPDRGNKLSQMFVKNKGVIPMTWISYNRDRKGQGGKWRAFLATVDKRAMPDSPVPPAPRRK